MMPEFYATTRGNSSASRGKLWADHRLRAPRLNSHQGDTRQETDGYRLRARRTVEPGAHLLLVHYYHVLSLLNYTTSHVARCTHSELPRCRLCGFQIPRVCCANMQLRGYCIEHLLTTGTEIGVAFCSGGRYAPTATNALTVQHRIDKTNRRTLSDGRCHDVF